MSILSDKPDGVGYFYGNLPDGRQLNVSHNLITKFWDIYVQSDIPIGYERTKRDAEIFGTAWALVNPDTGELTHVDSKVVLAQLLEE